MKKTLLLILICISLLNSCSTDVDNYADYKDITIVYGMLDKGVDTTFLKITKAYLGPGNALLFAQNPDSNNYATKLNVTLNGKKNGVNLQVITLDTLTIHNKLAGDSIFYFPNQLLYYTTANIDQEATYTLSVEKDTNIVSATSKVVQSFGITEPSNTFTVASTAVKQIKWITGVNGRRYDVVLKFNYREMLPGSSDTLYKSMSWFLGTQKSVSLTGGEILDVSYLGADFFSRLDDELEDIFNVKRWAGTVDIHISCGADELSSYIDVNAPSNSIVQELPDYTNVENGFGIFSSRLNVVRRYELNSISETKLVEDHNWGFIRNIK
ncbi:MAG: DUF4249 family protein [Bacteroidales bacterium]|nr:DUF4249 family protein [Bacteroidales bacterium]